MKDFICFLIILLFCGFLFFTGWTQIKVKPDYIGVVQSKTSGINQNPVIPGEFSWHKEFLIPTNAQINKFEYKPFNTTKTVTGKRTAFASETTLPYDILDYSFTFEISLSYTPQVIVDLLTENTISDQQTFIEYLDGVCSYLSQRAANYYLEQLSKDKDFRPESIRLNELMNSISFYKEYPEFDINVLALIDYKTPYYSIYEQVE